MRFCLVGLRLTVALLLVSGAGLRGQQAWQAKPEWVRAHEEFLASDVMAGRGSATRDEEIAATYVASQFMGYGLTPAPGMTSYLQAAEVVAPVLDGHATLRVGNGAAVEEGPGLRLLASSGESVHGKLVLLNGDALGKAYGLGGAVVLVRGDLAGNKAQQAYRAAAAAGASMVVLAESDATRAMSARLGGKTRVGMRVKETPGGAAALVVVSAEQARSLAEKSGTMLELTVHALPQAQQKTFNAIGYLAGSDAAAGTILLTAHLDHLGIGKPVAGDAIYNGANDDAAGTTAVLELAHALAAGPRLRRSVLFVCYGSEEAGELGSTYFGAHSPVPLTSLVANLEFEMIGNQDPKMPPGVLLLTGWERSNLGPELKRHGALVGPDPYPEQHFFERSDNYALALKGVVAHTAAGWGTVPTYHQPSDDLAHLDLPFMTAAIQSLIEPVRWLATSDFKPEWVAGGRPVAR